MGHRLRRITCDLDFKNPVRICWTLYKAFRFLTFKEGEKLILKRSKKGYHLFLWTRSYGDKFAIRKLLDDDKKHLAMDKLHRYGRQTMFSKKKKYKIQRGKSIKQ